MTEKKFETITLKRPADYDFRFEGRLISNTTTHTADGDAQNRYNSYELYETAPSVKSARYVFLDEYVTHWAREYGSVDIYTFDTLSEIADHFTFDGAIKPAIKELLTDAGHELVVTLQ